MPGGWELVAILAVLVLLFGATKLPMAARSIGQSMRIFKAETKGLRSDDPAPAPAPQPRVAPADPQVLPAAEPPQQRVERSPGAPDIPR